MPLSTPSLPPGLSLVVGLVLYISSINDEMLNRTKTNDAYFSYKYGWSFAFAAISFLLTEVRFLLGRCRFSNTLALFTRCLATKLRLI